MQHISVDQKLTIGYNVVIVNNTEQSMDRKAAYQIIKEFVETTHRYFESDSYSSGYLTSTVLDLLATAEPHRAMEVLSQIERDTREYKNKIKEVS
jgi:hypothetical protein